MLFTPETHEPLVATPWDADAARAAICEIAADCDAAMSAAGLWPLHRKDREKEDEGSYTTMYLGGAGVLFALSALARRDIVERDTDDASVLERLLETYRAAPEFEEWANPASLWMGETGILLTLQQIAPSTTTAARIAELVEANADAPQREFMWGSPGTMLAARAIDRADLWQQSADNLRAQWDDDSGLWTQHLYGEEQRLSGPAHGFGGCVNALAARPDEELHRRASATFKRLAIEEDGLANWTPGEEEPLVHRTGIRVQWCHGAPGMVASLAGIAPGDEEHERLLLAGGELTWLAGPLKKGANLCHGTAGNGLAFLKLFERTGDELWLERARAFAMHAIAQVAEERRAERQGRYSLWTGDPGTALYLALCLDGQASVPSFDATDFA